MVAVRTRTHHLDTTPTVARAETLPVAPRALAGVRDVLGPAAIHAVELRIDALLQRMSLAEKIGQLDCRNHGDATGPAILGHPLTVEEAARQGRVGSILNCMDPEKVAELQRAALASPNGIPILFAKDILAGLKTLGPGPLFLSSTMSEEDAYAAGRVAAEELKAFLGPSMTYATNLDDHVNPKNGRMVEAHGTAPWLNGLLGAAWIRGFQSVSGMVGCAKHWLGYGHADFGLDYRAATASDQQIEDDIKPPFYAAFAAGVPAVMVAFQALNGVPMHKNAAMNQELLARGLVLVSDWAGGGELVLQGVAKDGRDAALQMWRAGVTLDMMSGVYSNHLATLVEEGQVTLEELDQRLRPLLRMKLTMGLFDDPFPEEGAVAAHVGRTEQRDTMRRIAERSMVLVKNGPVGGKRILPLAAEVKTIAVLGPLADTPSALFGWWKGEASEAETKSVRQAFEERAQKTGQKILYGAGSHLLPPNPHASHAEAAEIERANKKLIKEAVALAKKAGIAVVVCGESAHMSGEAAVRLDPALPEPQRQLLKALHEANVPVVLVLGTGRPLTELDWALDHIPGIVVAGQPGTEGAEAIVDTLFGRRVDGTPVSPGGKLTVEWASTAGAVGAFTHRQPGSGRPSDDEEGEWRHNDGVKDGAFDHHGQMIDDRAWREAANRPSLAFGAGQSYTTFEVGRASLSKPVISVAELKKKGVDVTVRVTNTGALEGDETIQVYVKKRVADSVQPKLRLRGVQRITIAPNESGEVKIHLDPESFRYYSVERKRRVSDPGEFSIWVGTSAAPEDLQELTLDVIEKADAVGARGKAWELR